MPKITSRSRVASGRKLRSTKGDIKQAVKSINLLAAGRYNKIPKPVSSEDALGEAIFNFSLQLRELSDVAYRASVGDFTDRVQSPEFHFKGLAASLKTIVEKLKGMVELADVITQGQYRRAKFPKDSLNNINIALNSMIDALVVNEKINALYEKKIVHANTALKKLAATDPLTSISNRLNFSHEFERLVALSKRKKHSFGMLLIDIDLFKKINDALGHSVGDKVLVQFARFLEGFVRLSDRVVRMGGDEFAMILTEIRDRRELMGVAEKLLFALKQKYLIPGSRKKLSVSIGIACYPEDGEDEIALLKCADLALYRAKKHRGTYR